MHNHWRRIAVQRRRFGGLPRAVALLVLHLPSTSFYTRYPSDAQRAMLTNIWFKPYSEPLKPLSVDTALSALCSK